MAHVERDLEQVLSEIWNRRSARSRQDTDSLGREIMTDILITTAGTGLGVLLVLLAVQVLGVS